MKLSKRYIKNNLNTQKKYNHTKYFSAIFLIKEPTLTEKSNYAVWTIFLYINIMYK